MGTKAPNQTSIRISAPAKVNLFLSVLAVRPDGFHDVHTLLQAIALRDRLQFSLSTEGITLECDHPQVPRDEKNLCVKAARMMQGLAEQPCGVRIRLVKAIPVEAGLGGGSSDAAATLRALNQLWQLGLPQERLASMAASLGSDVPFFLYGRTALGGGRGERIMPLPTRRKRLWFVLVKPDYGVSTAWAYREWDLRDARREGSLESAIDAIWLRDPDCIAKALHNDLEKVILPKYPDLARAKQDLVSAGCLGALLCGSGSAVFGVAADEARARSVAASLAESYPWVWAGPTADMRIW